MDASHLRTLLDEVQRGTLACDAAHETLLKAFREQPFEDLGFARVDHHRALRQGFPEVIFCAGKTPEQVAQIGLRIQQHGSTLLATRADQSTFDAVQAVMPDARYNATARIISAPGTEAPHLGGTVGVLCAGTSDLPVAEEAACTLEVMGGCVTRINDVGVAGLPRLLASLETIQSFDVLIVCAGMEGALPSVVGGLVDCPVIAVPTSVGYGASFGGVAALLGMLNTCASGVSVVNIDNGFGAAAFAASILRKISS